MTAGQGKAVAMLLAGFFAGGVAMLALFWAISGRVPGSADLVPFALLALAWYAARKSGRKAGYDNRGEG